MNDSYAAAIANEIRNLVAEMRKINQELVNIKNEIRRK